MSRMNYAVALLASTTAALSLALPPALSSEEKAPSIDPVASVSTGQTEGADIANAIVQALNADKSLADSKITVRQEKDFVLLTGVSPSQQELQRATEIASQSANGAPVVNTIQPRKITYKQPEQEPNKT